MFEGWGQPHALLALPAVAVVAAALLRGRAVRRRTAAEFGVRAAAPAWTDVAAVALLVLAAADPRWDGATADVAGPATQVVFAVDVSRSMQVRDVEATRASLARDVLRRSLLALTGHPVGVIAFAGDAVWAVPLGRQPQLPKSWPAAAAGSDIGLAVREASEMFAPTDAGGRVLVLLTDGEDHAASPAAETDAVVLAVCVGTDAGGLVPADGGPLTVEGRPVVSRADPKRLATWTGGRPALPVTSIDDVPIAVRAIREAADDGSLGRRTLRGTTPLYPWLVGAALACMALECVRLRWGRRRASAAGVLTLLFCGASPGWIDDMRSGQRAADRGAWSKAARHYEQAFSRIPDPQSQATDAALPRRRAAAAYNRGTSLARSVLSGEQPDPDAALAAAVDALRQALRADPQMHSARINLQLIHRLRGGPDPPADADRPPDDDATPGEAPPTAGDEPTPDPFATAARPLGEDETRSLLDDVRRRDAGPSENGSTKRPNAAEKPW